MKRTKSPDIIWEEEAVLDAEERLAAAFSMLFGGEGNAELLPDSPVDTSAYKDNYSLKG